MPKILVLYYSAYGHIETMAEPWPRGPERPGADVTIKRVPELVPDDVAKKAGEGPPGAPIADADELADYDAIIFGTPTRFGNMAPRCATSSTRPAACG